MFGTHHKEKYSLYIIGYMDFRGRSRMQVQDDLKCEKKGYLGDEGRHRSGKRHARRQNTK